MPRSKDERPRWMQARLAFVWVRGARAPVYKKAVVRDRKTGLLAEVPLTELPPLDEGDPGETIVVAKGERLLSDHPAVQAKPMYFIEAPELVAVQRD